MTKSELVSILHTMPDMEIGGNEGFLINVTESSYSDANGKAVRYIHLEFSDE